MISRRGGKRFAAVVAALSSALAACALAVTPAGAAVYWGNNGTIAAANLDGSAANMDYFKPPFPADSAGPVGGVAVNQSYLYWAGAFAIGRVNLEGPATPQTITGRLQEPVAVAVDAAHLYWAERGTDAIGRASLDGGDALPGFISALDGPCGLAVDSEYVYWVGWRGIGRARLDGSQVEEEFIPLLPGSCGIAVDAGHIYFGGNGTIGRARLDGSEVEPAFIGGTDAVAAIAVDGGHIYWTDRPEGMIYSTIGRADLDGAEATRGWIATDQFGLGGVAVDARPTPPPLPLPSRPFLIGRVQHQSRTGAIVIRIVVPTYGELSLRSPALGWEVQKGSPPPYDEGSFTWRLEVWPGKSRFGRKIRAQLKRRGHARVNLVIAYAETGQLPVEALKVVTLIKHKPSRRPAHKGHRAGVSSPS